MLQASVAVVGAGVAGLVAARRLAAFGADVTVLERDPRPGGQVRTVTLAGLPVDVGAEALHAVPHVLGLVDELGLTEDLVAANRGRTWIWTERGLRPLPTGVGPAGPTRLRPVLGSRILSWRGVARAAAEPLVPHAAQAGDDGVGTFLSRRFGHEVTERLVDPLLGTLHAGDVSRISLHAVTPQLVAAAAGRRSLLLGRRRRRSGGPPSFVTFPSGLGTLVERLATDVEISVGVSAGVEAIAPSARGYRLECADGSAQHADAVVVALPAHAAARVLRPVASTAADGLGTIRTASVATVVVAYPRRAVASVPLFCDNGLLVPSWRGRLLKAAVFLGARWPHLASGDHYLVRLSAGRASSSAIDDLDDSELVERLHAELCEATGLNTLPADVVVQRWPRTLPQLEVGHLERLGAIRSELRGHPGLVLAGAPYEGPGIAACVRSGEEAAQEVRRSLQGREVAGR